MNVGSLISLSYNLVCWVALLAGLGKVLISKFIVGHQKILVSQKTIFIIGTLTDLGRLMSSTVFVFAALS